MFTDKLGSIELPHPQYQDGKKIPNYLQYMQFLNVKSKLYQVFIYNAITLNKCEIDRVHKNELYIATVSIKQKAVDRIKTALRFWFNATRISARMTSKTMTFATSISTIVMECYVNEQTDKKKMILQRSALSERRYRRFRLRSDSRTCCQNKQNGRQRSSTLVSK